MRVYNDLLESASCFYEKSDELFRFCASFQIPASLNLKTSRAAVDEDKVF